MRRPALLTAALLLGAFALPAGAEDEPPPHAIRFFEAYDRDGDGRVTEEEFGGSHDVFLLLDRDRDGVISPQDLGLPADVRPAPRRRGREGGAGREAGGERGRERKPGERPGGAGKEEPAGGREAERLRRLLAEWDADEDGRVSREEYGGAIPFDRLDRNGDGFLDAKDLEGAARGERLPGANLTPEALAERFRTWDRDGDGKLTPDEAPRPDLVARFDLDGDGALTLDELREGLARARTRRGEGAGPAPGSPPGSPPAPPPAAPRPLTREALRRFDRDGDGKVTRQEFPGSDERFAALDRDGDGVLTPADLPD